MQDILRQIILFFMNKTLKYRGKYAILLYIKQYYNASRYID